MSESYFDVCRRRVELATQKLYADKKLVKIAQDNFNQGEEPELFAALYDLQRMRWAMLNDANHYLELEKTKNA